MNTDDLRRQAGDPDWIVRRTVAEKAETPADVLAALTGDADKDVRRAVARNPNTPVDVLRGLTADPDAEVRRLAKRNASAQDASEPLPFTDSAEIATYSAPGPAPMAAAPNSGAPDAGSAAEDGVIRVRREARASNWIVRRGVAERPDVPAGVLAELAKDADKDVRRAVARNPKVSPKLLERLARDVDAEVRRGVARNPNASDETLKTLAGDTDELVRLTAVGLLALRPCSAEERAWLRDAAFGAVCAAPHPDEGERQPDGARSHRATPPPRLPKPHRPASTPPRLPDQARKAIAVAATGAVAATAAVAANAAIGADFVPDISGASDVPDASDTPDTVSKGQIVGKAIGRELTRGVIQRLGTLAIEGLFTLLSEM